MTDDVYDTMNDWLTPNGQKPPEPYIGMRMKIGKKCRLFNKNHALIYDLYKEDKSVVNDEIELLSKVWTKKNFNQLYEQHGLLYALSKLTHPETISRRRRELHQAGLIEYSPKAMKSRETAYRNERDKASPIPPQVAYRASTDGWDDTKQTLKVELPTQTRLV